MGEEWGGGCRGCSVLILGVLDGGVLVVLCSAIGMRGWWRLLLEGLVCPIPLK